MKHLCNKTKSVSAFTLIEMLVVVAIIAVLVSVAVPVFGSQMEKSRESTDIANMRNARSVLTTAYLSGDLEQGIDNIYYYDGAFSKTPSHDRIFGKGTFTDTNTDFMNNSNCEGCTYHSAQDYSKSFLIGYVDIEGGIHVHWVSSDLNFAPASLELPTKWKEWKRTDSAGNGGVLQREAVLKQMGLSDNHEYAIVYNATKPIDIYIYNGKFTPATKDVTALQASLDGNKYKDVNVTHYSYDEATKQTTLVGIETLRAGIKNHDSGNLFIQMKSEAEWEKDTKKIF